jgi:uncharacterized membrane protein YgcG
LFLIFGLLAIGTGAMGLVVLAILMLVVAVRFPGSEGRLYSAAIFIIWFCARWKLVAHNIRQYHLPSSKNQFLTWMRCFLFMPGSGRAASQGETSLVSYSFSFGSSGRHKNRRDDEDSGCGRGGRSGGAGASGEW